MRVHCCMPDGERYLVATLSLLHNREVFVRHSLRNPDTRSAAKLTLFAIAASVVVAASCHPVPVVEPCPAPLDVRSSGIYCGVDTRITPWAPADAYWEGATFQSDQGHGASRDITITFDAPVARVEVTAYDPTFAGNMMRAYDAAGTLVGSATFPGNNDPGDLTSQSRTLSGKISRVVLIAAKRDYLNYSMRVQYRGRRSK